MGNLVGARIAPPTRGNQVSLVRIHFSHLESDGKSADGGSNHDPDSPFPWRECDFAICNGNSKRSAQAIPAETLQEVMLVVSQETRSPTSAVPIHNLSDHNSKKL